MTGNMIKQLTLTCLAVSFAIALPVEVNAQSVRKRLDIIEKQLKAVQRKVFKPGSEFPRQADEQSTRQTPAVSGANVRLADIESRIAQMETQLRQLTGRIEESNYQADKLKQQMEVMARDYEFRLKELEAADSKAAQPAVSESLTTKKPTDDNTTDILPKGTAQQQYSYAQKLVTKGQYAKAEAALGEFLKRYPKAKLAGNAQYWLGQTYYVRKMYTRATRAFLEGYNSYPDSPKAPAFLLKIGMSLNAMGEKVDACDAYRELASRFPDSMENKNKRPPEEKRAGCL
ncbi:Cell division coordinator CpoB [hydrothermal vent metagenome]|uniref:Cell division coordinator CpoB n=1 Tax=hydrothermal vent metagenome TaxID=652676 RepID=A0A3B0RDE6_9ZZZZ